MFQIADRIPMLVKALMIESSALELTTLDVTELWNPLRGMMVQHFPQLFGSALAEKQKSNGRRKAKSATYEEEVESFPNTVLFAFFPKMNSTSIH